MAKIGDWNKVRKVAENLPSDLKSVQGLALAKLGLIAEAKAKQMIQDQPSSWDALSKPYLAQKLKRGESEKILVATSAYFQAISSAIQNNKVFIGVSKTKTNENGEVIADIAAVLEFGSVARNIPARPLWQIILEDMKDYVEQNNIAGKIYVQKIS